MADIDILERSPEGTGPRCRICGTELEPCPRGEQCVGTTPWRVLVVCECLRGLTCGHHGPQWAPAR